MPIGISTLSSFLLTKECQQAVIGIRLVFDGGVQLPQVVIDSQWLQAGLGKPWECSVFESPSGHIVMVLDKKKPHAPQ